MTLSPRELQLKRIHMRANHRGMKEMDIILSRFSAQVLGEASEETLNLFEILMEENDQEIFSWILGREETPVRYADLIGQIAVHAGARAAL